MSEGVRFNSSASGNAEHDRPNTKHWTPNTKCSPEKFPHPDDHSSDFSNLKTSDVLSLVKNSALMRLVSLLSTFT